MEIRVLGMAPSFGFGDRIGLATPGHVAAMQAAGTGIAPVFPQQSVREMARTGRTPDGVMRDAQRGAEQSGWTGISGADADHLKSEQDVDLTAAAGFTFFTIDPSAFVDQNADHYNESALRDRFRHIQTCCPWFQEYHGRTISLTGRRIIEFTEAVCLRAAVKYGAAIQHALRLSDHIGRIHTRLNRDYEIELSVDETDQPTTPAEHFIIADQCLKGGMKLVSLAPRFIGDFEKGVDFKGDRNGFEESLRDHAAIAETIGPYKLSLHSGSDKISVYRALSQAVNGRFHVKTAGTSYLEALRVVARHDEKLFRAIIQFARSRYSTDRATYHVSATLNSAPDPSHVSSAAVLEREYLEFWSDVPEETGFTKPGRQILHCTFGSVLTHDHYGPALRNILENRIATYTEVLREHFIRHLQALKAGF